MKPPQIKRKTFVRWLESQPDDRKFDYYNPRDCLLCNFFKEVHGVKVSVGGYTYDLVGGGESEKMPGWLSVGGVEGGAVAQACRVGLRWLKDFLRDQAIMEKP